MEGILSWSREDIMRTSSSSHVLRVEFLEAGGQHWRFLSRIRDKLDGGRGGHVDLKLEVDYRVAKRISPAQSRGLLNTAT